MFKALITKDQDTVYPGLRVASHKNHYRASQLLPVLDSKRQLLQVDSCYFFDNLYPSPNGFYWFSVCIASKCNNWIVIPPNNFDILIISVVLWSFFFPFHLFHVNQWAFHHTNLSHSSTETLLMQVWEQLVAWEKFCKVYTVITWAFSNFECILYPHKIQVAHQYYLPTFRHIFLQCSVIQYHLQEPKAYTQI